MENRIPLCCRWIIDRRHIFRESCGKMNSRKQVSSGTWSFIFRWIHSKIMEKCFLFILLHCNGILFSTIVWSQFSMKFVENVSGIWYSISRWLQSLLEIEFSAFNLKSFRGQSNADIAQFTLFALSLNGAASSGKRTFSAPLIFWHRFRSQIYLYILKVNTSTFVEKRP